MVWFKRINQLLGDNAVAFAKANTSQASVGFWALCPTASRLVAPYGPRFSNDYTPTIQSVHNQQHQWALRPMVDRLWQSKQRQHEKNNANQCIAIRRKPDRDH